MPRYWIGVASRDHVKTGEQGGFCQFCHGKAAPLKRMKKGDWIIYYSPKLYFQGQELCQKFTAMGEIVDDTVYQVEMFSGFFPHRRNVHFAVCHEVEIKPMIAELDFIKDKQNWGYQFRFGVLEINESDFNKISRRMLSISK